MADDDDLKRLMSGETDLSRCDFREVQLSGLDLRGRNFSHSLFGKAECGGTRFDGSDFRDADVSFLSAPGAFFDDCRLDGLHFGYTDLSGASLKGCQAPNAIFQNTNLNNADLRGGVFRNGSMNADTTLQGVISNDDTDFEGLGVLRPTSRDPLFKRYAYENGKLRLRRAYDVPFNVDITFKTKDDENVAARRSRSIETAGSQVRALLQNSVVTRVTAHQFAAQIEDVLRDVPASDRNMLAEPFQTMQEFAEVLRNLAPQDQLLGESLDHGTLVERIAELEALVEKLTSELGDEAKARLSAEALAKNDGFVANLRKSAGLAAGPALVGLVAVGIPQAAGYFLGLDNPVTSALNAVLARLPK